jgi:hypothetical protein
MDVVETIKRAVARVTGSAKLTPRELRERLRHTERNPRRPVGVRESFS